MTRDFLSCGYIQVTRASTGQYRNKWHSSTSTAWTTTSRPASPPSSPPPLPCNHNLPYPKKYRPSSSRGAKTYPYARERKLHLSPARKAPCASSQRLHCRPSTGRTPQHYPPTTPVAACYHLTWKDERIFRGQLQDLARIVKENNLTLTTMIVVGDAIDNREGLSKLYSHKFKHLFRN